MYRGFFGGYEIAKPIKDITVYDVLHAIEGPILLNRCLLQTEKCTRVRDKNCIYHKVFWEASEMLREKLSSINFADVINAEKE
jgi:Rrf2 family protein